MHQVWSLTREESVSVAVFKSVTWPADYNTEVVYSQDAGHNVWNIATAAGDFIQFGKHMKNP